MFTVPYVTPYWRLRLMKLHGRRRLSAKTPLSISAAVCWPWSPNDWEQRQRGARTPPQSIAHQDRGHCLLYLLFTNLLRFTVVLAGDPYHARVPSAHPRESEDAAGRQSSSVPSGQGARTTGASDQQELVQCTECPLRARRVFALVRFLPLSVLPRDEL